MDWRNTPVRASWGISYFQRAVIGLALILIGVISSAFVQFLSGLFLGIDLDPFTAGLIGVLIVGVVILIYAVSLNFHKRKK